MLDTGIRWARHGQTGYKSQQDLSEWRTLMPTTLRAQLNAAPRTQSRSITRQPHPGHNPTNTRESTSPRQAASRNRGLASAASLVQPKSRVPPSHSRFTVEIAFVWLGFFVAAGLAVLFGVDLACAWPLGRDMPGTETAFAVCGLILGYLSWNTYHDLR